MSQVSAKLYRLRGLFVIYFLVKLGVDFFMTRGLFGESMGHSMRGHTPLSPGDLFFVGLLSSGLMLALGLWVFHELMKKKNWARLTLLVVGWLAVVDAFSSLLFTSGGTRFVSWLSRLAPEVSWERLVALDRVTDLLGLFYWGYFIFVVQFDPEVKRELTRTEEAPPPAAPGV